MKKLPKIFAKPLGFTLVELLVVISIIAILATIGLVLFGNIQRGARDAKRRGDVDAISKAMEVYYSGGLYRPMNAQLFADGVIPTDPTNTNVVPDNTCPGVCEYCVRQGASAQTGAACSIATSPVAANMPLGGSSNPYWIVCTNLEAATPNFYCRGNQQ